MFVLDCILVRKNEANNFYGRKQFISFNPMVGNLFVEHYFFEFQHADKKKQRAIFCISCCQHWIQCCFCAITVLFLWRIFCSASKMTSKYPCSLVRNTQEQHGNCFMAILSYWHSGRESKHQIHRVYQLQARPCSFPCTAMDSRGHVILLLHCSFLCRAGLVATSKTLLNQKNNVATVQNCSFFLCIDWARLHGQKSWQ